MVVVFTHTLTHTHKLTQLNIYTFILCIGLHINIASYTTGQFAHFAFR